MKKTSSTPSKCSNVTKIYVICAIFVIFIFLRSTNTIKCVHTISSCANNKVRIGTVNVAKLMELCDCAYSSCDNGLCCSILGDKPPYESRCTVDQQSHCGAYQINWPEFKNWPSMRRPVF